MHVETGYFFIFGNILITAKNFRNRRKVLLTTIFYKSSGTFNETWTLILLAYNIFSKNSWFLFLDKSQVQKSVDVITCFSFTVIKQKFKTIQAHSWALPFQCYLSLSNCCVSFVYLHYSYQYYLYFTGGLSLIASNEQIHIYFFP